MMMADHLLYINLEILIPQAGKWQLPSTPLKETEKRADKWMQRQGWEQTELDAAVALVPKEFSAVVEASLLQYYDTSLGNRSAELKQLLENEANNELDLSSAYDGQIRDEAQSKLDALQDMVTEINDAMYIDPHSVGIVAPNDPVILYGDVLQGVAPLIDTNGDWVEQSINLITRKKYE